MEKRGYLDISFGWMFAIIVGIFILAFAFFFAQKYIGQEEYKIGTTTAKELGVILNPFEIGIESGSSPPPIKTPSNTRIFIGCDEDGVFGEQLISASFESTRGFSEPGVEIGFKNKYIFSEEMVEGDEFYVLIMPFNFPFKVADIMILTSTDKEYCFVDAPSDVKKDLLGENFRKDNFKIHPDCSRNSVKICFTSGNNCDTIVNYNQGYVMKDGKRLEFYDNLLYGAIFSDKDLYECQAKRLILRAEQLSDIYGEKADFLNIRGCQNNMGNDLSLFSSSLALYKDSSSLNFLSNQVKELETKDYNGRVCAIW